MLRRIRGLVTKLVLEIRPEELADIAKFFKEAQNTIKNN